MCVSYDDSVGIEHAALDSKCLLKFIIQHSLILQTNLFKDI